MSKELVTSGDIMRMFMEQDPKTILRRPNIRRFVIDNDIRYYVLERKWLIDYKEFFQKVNPRRVKENVVLPRIRCKRDCVELFNKENPLYIINKHVVDLCIECGHVTRFHHGNRWFVNYDELEKEILRYLEMEDIKIARSLGLSYSNLWHKLEEKGWTDIELAKAANLSASVISTMRKGQKVSMKTILNICEALRCNISDVVSFNKTN